MSVQSVTLYPPPLIFFFRHKYNPKHASSFEIRNHGFTDSDTFVRHERAPTLSELHLKQFDGKEENHLFENIEYVQIN